MKHFFLTLSLFTFSLFPFHLLSAQSFSSFSREEALEDLQYLEETLQTWHSGLYNHQAEAEFSAFMEEIRSEVEEENLAFAMLGWTARVIARTRDRHTRLVWYDKNGKLDLVRGISGDSVRLFPFGANYVQGKLYTWGNFSADSTLPSFAELISIQGMPAGEVLEELGEYVVADGCVKLSKYQDMANNLASFYYLFVGRPDTFQLQLRDVKTDSLWQVEVGALTRPERLANLQTRYGYLNPAPPYKLDFPDSLPNTAVLAINTLYEKPYKDTGLRYKKAFKQVFGAIRESKAKNLILDLRKNGGGETKMLYDIFRYFAFEPEDRPIMKSHNVNSGKDYFRPFPKPRSKAFSGRVIVLISPTTFSNATVLTNYLRAFYPRTTVIGQESGGCYSRFTASSKRHFQLPNSGIEFRIPTQNKNYFVEWPDQPCRGVIPDVELEASVQEIFEKKDIVMKKAVSLIKNPGGE